MPASRVQTRLVNSKNIAFFGYYHERRKFRSVEETQNNDGAVPYLQTMLNVADNSTVGSPFKGEIRFVSFLTTALYL